MTLEALMTLPFGLGGVGGGSPGSACELPRPQSCVADDDDDDDDDDGDDHDGDDDDGDDDDDHNDIGHDDDGDDDGDDDDDDDRDDDDDDNHDNDDDDDLSRSGQTIAFDRSFTKSKHTIKVQKDLCT